MKDDRLNHALALMDAMVAALFSSQKMLARMAEDAEEQAEILSEVMDEYERLAAIWAEEDEDESPN